MQRIVALWPSSVCRHLLEQKGVRSGHRDKHPHPTLFQRSKPEGPYHIRHSQPMKFSVPIQRNQNLCSSSEKTMTTTLSRPTKRPKPLPDNQPTSDSTHPSGD